MSHRPAYSRGVAPGAVILVALFTVACSGGSPTSPTSPTAAPAPVSPPPAAPAPAPAPVVSFRSDWNAFVDGLNACFATQACRAESSAAMCSCVTSTFERQSVTWAGTYDGPSPTSADAVRIRMPARRITWTSGVAYDVANPILLQSLPSSDVADWRTVAPGTPVRFQTTIGTIRMIGTGFAGSGPPSLIFTTSGGQRRP
ncbi:MAG: hypothetical protein HOP16_09815 [Acidobacteria bacterium]|nr:hypothetical protein [Acidobacteriota bacterium]